MLRFVSVIASGLLLAASASAAAPDSIAITIDATRPGPTISRHLFGQFAEHLGQRHLWRRLGWAGFPHPQHAWHAQ